MDVDRRVIEIVMVDCEENPPQGKSNFDGEGFIQLFVLGPWVVNGTGSGNQKQQIYTEVIGPVDKDVQKERAVEIVQLYE